MSDRYACLVCDRTDLSLTSNGRIRSHAANGKRPGPDNPACGGGSDLPRMVETDDFGQPLRECWHCDRVGCTGCVQATASGGPNPWRAPLPTGNLPHDRQPTDTPTEERDPWRTISTHQSSLTTTNQVPGSPQATTETATPAESPSSKATRSVPTEKAGTRDGSAAVTTDVFEAASAIKTDNEPKRDRWGRYLLPHPETGKRQAWTRATTMAKSISDTFALSQWSQRMVIKGLSVRPDLVSLAHSLDVRKDKDKLNSIAEQAKDAAGQKVSANLGTAVHALTESVDAGAALDTVPPQHQSDVAAYLAAMSEAGLTVVPHLIERITVANQFDVAGTFDRVLKTADGDYVIGDLKTGRTLEYGWPEIAIQLALYAHGVNEAGVYDLAAERWDQVPQVRTDYGIVMHLPVGESICTLYRIDLTQGWAAARLCASVRDWRKARNLAEPYVVAEAPSPYLDLLAAAVGDIGHVAVRPPTWAERFAAVSSRGEASALYAEALEALGNGPELALLVKVGMAQLAALEERAG